MEYAFLIYLATRVDIFIIISAVCLIITAVFCVIASIKLHDGREKFRPLRDRCVRIIIVLLTIILITPTSAHLKYMVAGYMLQSTESDVKRVAGKSFKLFEEWLDKQEME